MKEVGFYGQEPEVMAQKEVVAQKYLHLIAWEAGKYSLPVF